MKPKHIINLTLQDCFVKKGTSGAKAFGNHMIHMDIVNDNLVITIDYEHGQFALWKAYEIMGLDPREAAKKSLEVFEKEALVSSMEDEFLT